MYVEYYAVGGTWVRVRKSAVNGCGTCKNDMTLSSLIPVPASCWEATAALPSERTSGCGGRELNGKPTHNSMLLNP